MSGQPDCFLLLLLSAGSINVNARLTIPDSNQVGDSNGVGSGGSAATYVIAAAQDFITQSQADLTTVLGVSVASVAPSVGVQTGVSAPIIVAPPPPSSPPPETPPPTLPPPLVSPAGSAMVGVIFGAVGGILVLLLGLLYCHRKRLFCRDGLVKRGPPSIASTTSKHSGAQGSHYVANVAVSVASQSVGEGPSLEIDSKQDRREQADLREPSSNDLVVITLPVPQKR